MAEVDFSEIMVAFLTGGSAVALIRLTSALLLKSSRAKAEVAIKDIDWIYSTLQELKRKMHADDIWIGRSANGGGIPRVGHTVFHQFEYHLTDLSPLPPASKKMPVDKGLASFLARTAANRVTIQNASLFTDEIYKIFNDRKIKFVVSFHIHSTDKSLFYLGLGFKDSPRMKYESQAEVMKAADGIKKKLAAAKS